MRILGEGANDTLLSVRLSGQENRGDELNGDYFCTSEFLSNIGEWNGSRC